jgi:hypothetical protein
VVTIRAPPRVNVCHQVQHAVPHKDPITREDGDVMPGFYSNSSVNLEVCIDDDHIPHFPRSNIVYVDYPGSLDKGLTYSRDFLLVYRAIHQVV